jgi:hypothetical protein
VEGGAVWGGYCCLKTMRWERVDCWIASEDGMVDLEFVWLENWKCH